jgi:hypothetical protein
MQTRHAGLDPASSVFLDSRPLPAKGQARGNDSFKLFNCRSNTYNNTDMKLYLTNGCLMFPM